MNKAVALSHLNISVSTVQSASSWEYYKQGEVVLGVIPFYHIYGAGTVVLQSMYIGAPVVILPRFNPEQCLSAIERFKINVSVHSNYIGHTSIDYLLGRDCCTTLANIPRN